jgi:hypothetical protein
MFYDIASEWLLFSAIRIICEPYHGEKHVIFQWYDDDVCFVLDQHAWLDFYSVGCFSQSLFLSETTVHG